MINTQMINTQNQLQLLDVVAFKHALPENALLADQVGTIVDLLAPDVYEVDFSDNNGQTDASYRYMQANC